MKSIVEAARENIKKAQERWKNMTHLERAHAQPEGREREKVGVKGTGEYYRVIVRPKQQFVTFRVQDVGRKGHAERLAGMRQNGKWDTHAWLIHKNDAHIEHGRLVADEFQTKKILSNLATTPRHLRGDIFEAKDRRNVPERSKPTAKQRKARKRNIKKAQRARRMR